jgi:hypothetical protein
MIKLKNILLESMGNALNESDNATYEQRVKKAKDFADTLTSVTFMGYGFNELEPNLFKGEFRIMGDADDYNNAYEAISIDYVIDEKGSSAYPPEGDEDRRYYPTIKIIGIKDSAEKPEFEIYIDSVDIGNTTITSPNDTTTFDDFRTDIQDQLEAEGDNFVKAKIECRCRVDNVDYKFQFETDDPDTTADNIYWDSDSFEQETGLDEQDILDKLTA